MDVVGHGIFCIGKRIQCSHDDDDDTADPIWYIIFKWLLTVYFASKYAFYDALIEEYRPETYHISIKPTDQKKLINHLLLIIFMYLQNMELNTMSSNKMREREERRYSVPHGPNAPLPPAASEDLHAWSIYR